MTHVDARRLTDFAERIKALESGFRPKDTFEFIEGEIHTG